MNCEWCYIPFVRGPPEPSICRRVVARVAELGFQVITIAGGDPLSYDFLPALITGAKRDGLKVHVDTNGIGTRRANITLAQIADQVDLLGLPLDGPSAEIHDRMRSARLHFALVMTLLTQLATSMERVKINTIVSALNAAEVSKMVDLIGGISPSRWSLYQYWPLSLGKRVASEHSISTERFMLVAGGIAAAMGNVLLESNPLPSRRLTYPFVSHDGIAYVHDKADFSAYQVVGSIFEDTTARTLLRTCGPERAAAGTRYVSGEQVAGARPKALPL